jgi:WD40 repeat protein
MNDIPDPHPTPQALAAFSLGQITGAEAASVEEHLTICDACRTTVDGAPPDSFVSLLRGARQQSTEPPTTPPATGTGHPEAATPSLSPAPAPGPVPPALVDHARYRIQELLGVGGMGAVYRAEHQLMERTVALKVINRSLTDNPDTVERFRREVKAAARLTHPNIVTAHDADQAGDTHFLVMEYVEGTNLARLVAERGRLPAAQACDYVRQAALGLQHAFEQGMVHRDIKPQNLMLTPRGQVKILDFGLARFALETAPAGALLTADPATPAAGDSLTQVGTVVGTPDYIAPEQARDAHTADIRADIYSLGCTLYDLLAGHAPFPEGTAVQKVMAHLEKTPRPLTELRNDVPAKLVCIVERMMAKQPEQRYATPAEVAAALTPFTGEAPLRRAKPLRGWRLVAASVCLVMLVPLAYLTNVLLDNLPGIFLHGPSGRDGTGPDAANSFTASNPVPAAAGVSGESAWGRDKLRPALNTDGHTAPVTQALFTHDGAHLITVSLDQTIRIWDVDTGECLQVLRPPLGSGQVGSLTAAALSPDGQMLAVGGNTTLDGSEGPQRGVIFLVVLTFLRLEGVLTAEQPGNLRALAFAPNGERLASNAGDTAILWDLKTKQSRPVLFRHKGDITGLAFSPDGRRLASVSSDKTLHLCSTEGTEMLGPSVEDPLNCVAWSPDGQTLATAGTGSGQVFLWNADGTLRQRLSRTQLNLPPAHRQPSTKDNPFVVVRSLKGLDPVRNLDWIGSLSFTADSKELLITWCVIEDEENHGERGGSLVNLGDGQCRQSFRGPVFFRGAQGALSPDAKTAVTTGGNDHDIVLWRTADGSEAQRLAGRGRTPFRVGWKPGSLTIAWANARADAALATDQPLQRAFDLAKWRFEPESNFAPFQCEQRTREGLSLGVTAEPSQLAVIQGQAFLARFKARSPVWCYALLPGGRAVVGDQFGPLLFDARRGKLLRSFQGCDQPVLNIVPSPDGRYLLAALSDQTLRLWNAEEEQPLLSLFVAGNDWVAWTPEGYYDASPGGERCLGLQVSNGPRAFCSFQGMAQFRKSLRRPDVIARLLDAGTVARALDLADHEAGQRSQPVTPDQVLPPKVVLLAPSQNGLSVQESKFVVRASAEGVGQNELKTMKLLLDGRPCSASYSARLVSASVAPPGKMEMEWTVTLPPGRHRLSVLAEGQQSNGISDEVWVTNAQVQQPPNLYVLSIGIDAYPENRKLACSANDARELAQTFKAKSQKLFGKVETRVLLDTAATRAGILQELDWLKTQVQEQDVAVIFFAGHGTRGDMKRGEFLLVPQDIDPKQVDQTAVSGTELKKRLAELKARRVLLLLDADQGEALLARENDGGSRENLVRGLTGSDCGVVVLCAAEGVEHSLEDPKVKHGYFTLALIEGLSGKGDTNKAGEVTLARLYDYVQNRVGELSKDRQHPVLVGLTAVRSLALSKP